MKYILTLLLLGSLLTNTSAQASMSLAELSEMKERTENFNAALDAYIDGQDGFKSRKGIMRGITNLSAALYNFNTSIEHYSNPDNVNEKDISWTEQRIKDGAFFLNFTRAGEEEFANNVREAMRVKTYFKNLGYRFDQTNENHIQELKNFQSAVNYCLNVQSEFAQANK